MDRLNMHTSNRIDENIRRIGELFPNTLTEWKNEKGETEMAIDFDVLKQELSQAVVEGLEERYQFTWPDKKKSMLLANAPISDTLRPCREESVDFDTTENLYIEGDNLSVLKLLQETYLGKVKMIYIDPPYNTGNDYVYEDDFAQNASDYLANSGQYDAEGNQLMKNLDSNGRFHTDWLNMIYPRLKLARDLLSDDGVILISIDDNEIENLKKCCNEIFGEANYVATFIWDGGRRNDSKRVSVGHEYIVTYIKVQQEDNGDMAFWKERKEGIDEIYDQYNRLRGRYYSDWRVICAEIKKWYTSLPDGHPAKAHKHYCNVDENGVYFASDMSGPDDGRKNRPRYSVLHPVTGKAVPIPSRGWRWEEKRMIEEISKNRVHFGEDESSIPNGKVYLKENEWQAPSSVFYKDRRAASNELKKLFNEKVFDFPKDTNVLERLFSLVCRDGDIILDFFSGSGSSAEAAIKLSINRSIQIKFILVQLPEAIPVDSRTAMVGFKNICEIGKERIRRAGAKIKAEIEQANQQVRLDEEPKQMPDIGFRVLKLDSSNMKDVYYTPEEYTQLDLTTLADNIKEDRTPEDLLFQVMLELGVLLSSPIEASTIAGKQVFRVADNFLIACFDKDITNDTVTAIARLKPYYAVFRDSSYANDAVAVNFEQIFAAYSPDTVRRVL